MWKRASIPFVARFIALFIAIAMPFIAAAQTAPPGATVGELLEILDRENPDAIAARYETEAARARVDPAGAFPDPIFRMELRDIPREDPSLSPSRVGSTRYLFMQTLPFWGKRDLRREVAAAGADAAEGQRRAMVADLRARLKIAFALHYQARQSTRMTDEILAVAQDLQRIAETRYASGVAPQQDVIRAQVEVTTLRGELIALDNADSAARARLNALLNRRPDEPLAEPLALRPQPTPAVLEPHALEEKLRERNPGIFTQAAQLDAAERNVRLVERNRYPDFTLGVAPIQQQNSVTMWEVMLEMNIPLQQGARRSQEFEAERMADAARAKRDAAIARALGEFREAQAALDAAQRTVVLLRDRQTPQAELTFQSALASYRTGKVDFATLLEAHHQVWRTRLETLRAEVEQEMRLAEIERLLGEDL